jgi:hypothetical protein
VLVKKIVACWENEGATASVLVRKRSDYGEYRDSISSTTYISRMLCVRNVWLPVSNKVLNNK